MENKTENLEPKIQFKIDKPLIFFDLETTGLDFENDRIIEISAIKFFPNGSKQDLYLIINPDGVQISEGAKEKFKDRENKITDEILKKYKTFSHHKDEILNFFKDSNLCGYNIRYFDIPFLVEEFRRNGINDFTPEKNDTKIIDTYNILTKKEPRKLENTYEYYTGKKLENAHSALDDNNAVVEILNKQHEKYYKDEVDFLETANIDCKTDSNGNTIIDFSGMFMRNKEGDIIFGKGKHNGEKISKENISYINWLIEKSNFNNSTKGIAKTIRDWFLRNNK